LQPSELPASPPQRSSDRQNPRPALRHRLSRRFALIVNPAAARGRALDALPPALTELRSLGVEHRVVRALGLPHARAEAAAAVGRSETVVAVGGDGLVGALAGAVSDADGTLAIVPAGRGNDFARVLDVPRAAGAAARLAVEGRPRAVDLGEVEGRAFVGIASVGIDSDANRVARRAQLVRGELVYFYAALRALVAWRHACFEIVADGATASVRGYSVAVANSRAYGGGMILVPHARLDDGRLDVLTIAAHPKLRFLRSFPRVFSGRHIEDPALRFTTATSVELSADRPLVVYADGEPIATLPVTVRVRPGALRVIAR